MAVYLITAKSKKYSRHFNVSKKTSNDSNKK